MREPFDLSREAALTLCLTTMDLPEHQTWNNGKHGRFAQYSSHSYFTLDVPVSNADGSKTPTGSTMANLLDRFHNQEVPYAPEEIVWSEFELVESLSTSPTSVRTPDDDTFERDSKDFAPSMRDFYQHSGISPQSRQGQAGVMDVSVEGMEYFNNCFSQGQINKLIFGSQC